MHHYMESLDSNRSSYSHRSSKSKKSSRSGKLSRSSASDRASRYSIPDGDDCIFDVHASKVEWAHPPEEPYVRRFDYTDLDVIHNQIRLFRVSLTEDGLAVGSLERFDLRRTPPFKALSYTWGDNAQFERIYVNGESFAIAQNVFHFLELFGARHLDEYIWIDQICIAQSATDERNEQVRLMSQIFRRAEEVVLWIKPSEDLECRIGDAQRHWYGDGSWECDRIMDLLTNGYWSRVWILQEVLLGRQRRIYYGNYVLEWDVLFRFVTGNMSSRRSSVPSTSPPPYDHRIDLRPQAIPDQLLWLVEHPPSPSFGTIDFADAIRNCCRSQSKDLRDKVYALQGLLSRDQKVPVEYRKSVKEVFIDAAMVYPTCSDEPGPLLALATSMEMQHRPGGSTNNVLSLILEVVDWYNTHRRSPRTERDLRKLLTQNLTGPSTLAIPPAPPMAPQSIYYQS